MCNCLVVTKPLIQRYAGTLLSFNTSGNWYGSKSKGSVLEPQQDRQGSYPLNSMDRGVTGAEDHPGGRKKQCNTSKEILVTDTYSVREEDEDNASHTRNTNERGARGFEFDTESQEEIGKRVRTFQV